MPNLFNLDLDRALPAGRQMVDHRAEPAANRADESKDNNGMRGKIPKSGPKNRGIFAG
jgi:hypothetical protein